MKNWGFDGVRPILICEDILMGAAAPVFTVAMGAAQYQAQGKIGKYNQAVNNRNAAVLEVKQHK